MESNKDEAERCVQLGHKYEQEGDIEKALRFFIKSVKLYPTEHAQTCVTRTEIKMREHTKTTSSSKQRETETTATASIRTETVQKEFTKEQLDLVKKINGSRDYYEILGLKRNCTDVEIKKAYKRLALQMHPDKNGAPGAEEAFKKVNQAFSCLSDPSKRGIYDVRGSEEPVGSRVRHSYDGDLTPDEIFAAFFGGGTFGQPSPMRSRRGAGTSGFRTYTYTSNGWGAAGTSRGRGRADHHHEVHEANSVTWSCLQFLPILMIFLLAFLSSPSEPLFQLQRTAKFTLQQTTKSGIQYWVKPDFFQVYDTSGSLGQLEAMVEDTWVKEMRSECYSEQQQKERLRRQAYYYSGTNHGKTLDAQYKEFKTPACDALKKAGVRGAWQ